MSKIPIIDNGHASLWYYPETKIVHHQIKKYIYGEQFQNLLNKGTEILRKNKAEKWLSDDSNNSAIRPEDSEWANSVWFPNTVKAGWKYWALVQSQKIIGQINMKRFTKLYSDKELTVKVFDNLDEALKWLESQ